MTLLLLVQLEPAPRHLAEPSGVALGGLMVPLVTVLIDTLGWRTAMLGLGLGMWV